jgi:hypothetical protein
MSLSTVCAGLLVVGGVINAIPPVSEQLTKVTGDKPILQVLVGMVSVVIGFILIAQLF